MNSAAIFKEFHEASFLLEIDQLKAKQISDEFISDFIYYTPIQIELLRVYLVGGHIDLFYKSLSELKNLIEFSDHFNRYWHLLRGYSGALSKLKNRQSVKSSKKIYSYYFSKYGDRRQLRKEHWFEKKRWEFLDELHTISTEEELESFISRYQLVLIENLKIYTSFMMDFIVDLQNIQAEPKKFNHPI